MRHYMATRAVPSLTTNHYLMGFCSNTNYPLYPSVIFFINGYSSYTRQPLQLPPLTLYLLQTQKEKPPSPSFTLQIIIPKPITSSLLSLSQITLLSINPQQEEIVKFFQEYNQQEQHSSSTTSSTIAKLSSPVRKAITMAIDEKHITKRAPHIHCGFKADTLQVLKEYRVDFDNIAKKSSDLDLREEMISQGWENYFARLHGPVYELLIKEFWRHAECDNHYVVSHVLGRKIVISEKSITKLLGLPHLQGLRVHGRESDLPARAVNFVHNEIYGDYAPEKPKKAYKVKTLQPKSRAWHKIFLGCLNPRPHSSSADFININQKYYLYCLKKGKNLSLPFIIFHYLKKSITATRTTASGEDAKKPRYVPFGRLLSDILIESGLVQLVDF